MTTPKTPGPYKMDQPNWFGRKYRWVKDSTICHPNGNSRQRRKAYKIWEKESKSRGVTS